MSTLDKLTDQKHWYEGYSGQHSQWLGGDIDIPTAAKELTEMRARVAELTAALEEINKYRGQNDMWLEKIVRKALKGSKK